MYVCFKQDLKRNVSYVGNMTVKLMKEGLCDVEE